VAPDQEVLELKTERSALLLRKLFGKIVATSGGWVPVPEGEPSFNVALEKNRHRIFHFSGVVGASSTTFRLAP
jgi:hypothetical protein